MRWSIARLSTIHNQLQYCRLSAWSATVSTRYRMASTTKGQTADTLLDDHRRDVEKISQTIKAFHAQGQKYRINHGSTNSTRTGRKGTSFVDLSQLNRVLKVDVAGRTALVEPNVPMDRLVEATLPHGLVPPVVMEFPGITAGGGYAGTSGESSSFRHGFFDRTLDWVEIVLADGEIVRASAPEGNEHADLFRAAAGAVGSLGTTTLVQLRLKPAKAFVEVTYHPVRNGMGEAIELSGKLARDDRVEYLDGIMYDRQQGVIITGRGISSMEPATRIQRFSGRWDPYFYLHARSRIAASLADSSASSSAVALSGTIPPERDVVPLAEYLFRYDRGGFWVAPMAFQYFHMPYNRVTRALLDDFLHTRMMYTALHSGGAGRDIIIQDLALPMDERAVEFVEYTDREFGIYPLWLCPLRTEPGPSFHPHVKDDGRARTRTEADGEEGGGGGGEGGRKSSLMMNIGLWGWAPPPPPSKKGTISAKEHHLALNRSLESKLVELGGMKWLYAKTFYDEASFWRDHVGGAGEAKEWYGSLRGKYRATGLPSVWEKTHTDLESEWGTAPAGGGHGRSWRRVLLDIWPLGGLYGLWKAIRSGTYRAARASRWRSFGGEFGRGEKGGGEGTEGGGEGTEGGGEGTEGGGEGTEGEGKGRDEKKDL